MLTRKVAFIVVVLGLSTASLGKEVPTNQLRLTFHGPVDGSELLEITATHALWTNRHWRGAGAPVVINDVKWSPLKQPLLMNSGKTKFLPHPVDFSTARLENVKGRDTVAVEPGKNGIKIHLVDSPNGAAVYQFDVVFDAPRAKNEIRICGQIDGSERLLITKKAAHWTHRHWGWPSNLRINNTSWNPRKYDTLLNKNKWVFPSDRQLANVRLIVHQGRDLATLRVTDEGLEVLFVDNPLGAAKYDVSISFE